MIQRIQSIYLFLAFSASLLLYEVPFCRVFVASSQGNDINQKLLLTFHGIYNSTSSGQIFISPARIFAFLIPVSAIMCLSALLLFKKLKLQQDITKLAMIISVLLFSSVNYFLFTMTDLAGSEGHIRFLAGWYIPLIQLFFLYLAARSILADRELLRSADRLR